VKSGMTVTVEPAVPSAPEKSQALHRTAVTGIAISAHSKRPLVVSSGADGSARVWDVVGTQTAYHLPHPCPVRSVACSPAAAKADVAVTGGDDGIIRVWDLSTPEKLPSEPKALADAHTSPVGVIAFSPDGRFLATAAGRDVFIWDAVEWKKLYALPSEHRDVVTSLQMTPQGTLVTASKDRTLKVWKLGAQQAAVARTLDHRAGAVDILGVTSDGGRVVFDQDKNRLDLIGLADRQTTGQVQNVGPTAAFATLAVFNQDDTLLLTAGGEGELKGGLQVWNLPKEGGRGAEVARLFTPVRIGVTAAGFSPSSDHRFLAAGDEKGNVHIWSPPSANRQAHTGTVVYYDSVDPRYLTVRVEMDNRKLNLLERSTATVIITPAK
jgi:WD40 repeat protein